MRVGTWNLEAKWTSRHAGVLAAQDCDIWLLTEVRSELTMPGYAITHSPERMLLGQHYSAVLARTDLVALPSPHGATAMATVSGLMVCASVLPWNSAPPGPPWSGGTPAERSAAAIADIIPALTLPAIWGGDWNHPLTGSDLGFYAGRGATLAALDSLGLVPVTAELPSRLGTGSIDHIAIPAAWRVDSVRHVSIPAQLSDHDLYVVEAHGDGR